MEIGWEIDAILVFSDESFVYCFIVLFMMKGGISLLTVEEGSIDYICPYAASLELFFD